MIVIDGRKIAAQILDRLHTLPMPKKFLAGVLVGDDPASASFQSIKQKTAEELGVDYRIYRFPADIKNDPLREAVGKIARHKTCGGVLLQLPLPVHLNRHYVVNAIPREKDPDVLTERSLGACYVGRNPVSHPSVGVVEEILKETKFELKNKKVAVVGPGFLIGKPIAVWLMGKTSDIYILDVGADLAILKQADLVILGAGVAGIVTLDMLKDGAGVVDFGYTKREKSDERKGKIELAGDFDTSSFGTLPPSLVSLRFYTPTPGGTGPILVAKLFENFYILNKD